MFRPLIKWKEPKEYLETLDKIEDAKEKPWHRPVLAAFAIISLLALRALSQINPQSNPVPLWTLILLGPFYAWFLVWAVPWINRRSSSKVQFFKKSAVQTRGNGILNVAFKDFSSYYWLSGENFYTLILVRRKDDASSRRRFESFGVPDDSVKDEVTEFLQTAGLLEAPCEESATHLQTFPSLISWKRILIHLSITLALIVGSVLVLVYYPAARRALRIEGGILLVLGLPSLYLGLTLALAKYQRMKQKRLRKDSEGRLE